MSNFDEEKLLQIASRIKEVRESKNLTQGELGRLVHADKSKVSRIENNSRSVALSDIVDIAKALDVRLEYLLGIDSCIDETSECIETLVRSFTKITTTKAYTDNIKKSALCDVEDAVFCIDEDYLMLVGRNSIFFLIKDIATAENAKGHVSPNVYTKMIATVYKGNIIKNLIMDCQSYTKYRPNETTGGIFVSWRRKEELPTGA